MYVWALSASERVLSPLELVAAGTIPELMSTGGAPIAVAGVLLVTVPDHIDRRPVKCSLFYWVGSSGRSTGDYRDSG